MRWRLPLSATLALVAAAARADDGVDSPMYRDPDLPLPTLVLKLPARLPGLWVESLARPEADLKAQAAQAIARAHEMGIAGMPATAAALARELDRPDQHPTVRLAVARALVVLDAKDAAAALTRAADADPEIRELVDPALARWDYRPARAGWLERLGRPTTRGAVLALRSLGTVREAAAVPRLREIALDRTVPAAVRLEAARALAEARPAGGEADARGLAADPSRRGLTDRLVAASLLRRHDGAEAVKQLRAFVRDPEPAVAAVALARLVELDPGHVVPLLEPVLASPDANVRGFGVEVLTRRPSEPHVRLLADRLNDPHPAVRGRARRGLRELAGKDEWKAPVIREGTRILGGDDWRGLEQAALLLGGLDHKPAAPRLLALLRQDRREVFVTAAWGLRQLAVPETLPAVHAFFRERYDSLKGGGVGPPPVDSAAADHQLSQLGQLLGRTRYGPADAVFRRLVPPSSGAGPETRAAAIWALGLLHEGKEVPDLVRPLVGRLSAVAPPDTEDERVRRMAAVTLGRMKAASAVTSLRRFYTANRPSDDPVGNACGWALERVTGEPYPAPGVIEAVRRDWFLAPLD